jgi:hypothetical protein
MGILPNEPWVARSARITPFAIAERAIPGYYMLVALVDDSAGRIVRVER